MNEKEELKAVTTALHYCCLTKDLKHAERVVKEVGIESIRKLVRIVNEED